MPKKPMEVTNLELPAIDYRTLEFKIRGLAPLIQNRFPDSARKQIRDKKMATAEAQTGKKKTYRKQDPEQECKEHTHFTNKGKYGLPVFAISKALVATGMRNGIADSIQLRAALTVMSTNGDGAMLELACSKPITREDIVKLANGAPDICWRPQFDKWATSFRVRFNSAKISAEQLIQLVRMTGLETGLGAWRPENKNGWAGTFEIDGNVKTVSV